MSVKEYIAKEKEHIDSLLRSALSRRISDDPSLKTNELFKAGAREAVEKAKFELHVSFNRLKVLAHEAIKKRDVVVRSNEKLSVELMEIGKEKEELMKQKEEVVKELEESVKAKEGVKSEIGTAAQMLVTGIDKISGKVNQFKNLTAGGLRRSQRYTRLLVVAYGVIKGRNEAREHAGAIIFSLKNKLVCTLKIIY
ncbi:hypothetical protein HanXRQr2_Chr13g0575031 [Helianthus annuus]|uniref:Uncharacterized protein n=1 Tax=Helianthus annuus TaxID=4232 RepID=A0A251SPR5_HELAN|nr:hypothetical protein HanXRQr2_Chr13g0575031 [Helianthus annuus]KAJ0496716.1 hypothetical protein HanHA89_Chr13g0502991 [Helianthus annuus]